MFDYRRVFSHLCAIGRNPEGRGRRHNQLVKIKSADVSR